MATDDDEPDGIDQFKRATALWSQAIEQAADEGIPIHIQMVAMGVVIAGACLTSGDAEGTFRMIGRIARDAIEDRQFGEIADRVRARHCN